MHMTTMLKRIEALEKAVSGKYARATEDRIRDRALEHLSNDELALLIKGCRALEQGSEVANSEWAALQAYQAALAQEGQRTAG
jgi:hypothetical protein